MSNPEPEFKNPEDALEWLLRQPVGSSVTYTDDYQTYHGVRTGEDTVKLTLSGLDDLPDETLDYTPDELLAVVAFYRMIEGTVSAFADEA